MKNVFKKISVAMMAVLSVTATNAVELPFDVEAPSWTMYAEYVGDGSGVNIRQQPSTTAARMVVNWNKVDNFQVPLCWFSHWSKATPKSPIESVPFKESAPIISERDGWLQLYGIGPKFSNGWVSAKFCVKKPIKPFTEFDNVQTIERNGEKYAIRLIYDGLDDYAEIYVGKYINGFLVAPYVYTAQCSTSQNGKVYLEDDCLFYPREENDTECSDNEPNIKNFSDRMIDYIISKATPMAHPEIWYGE